jgi:hypothetical protein
MHKELYMSVHSNITHLHIQLDPDVKMRMELFACVQRLTKRQVVQAALVQYLDGIPGPFESPDWREHIAPQAAK